MEKRTISVESTDAYLLFELKNMLKDTVGDKITQVYIFNKRAMRQVKR